MAPSFRQVFLVADASGPRPGLRGMELERVVYALRKRAEHKIDDCYFPSLSARTVIYKGMLTSHQLRRVLPRPVRRAASVSGLALVHSRFSTNTFPSWPLAHPYRYMAHNGEINTVAGNRNWMRAREALCATDLIPGDLDRVFPIVHARAPATRPRFDEVARAAAPRRPAAPPRRADDDPRGVGEPRRRWTRPAGPSTASTRSLMEPWDGPAAVAFTDGTVIGAVLDRNGLRPARYWVTDDGLVVLASEVGVLDVAPATRRAQGPPPARPDVPGRHRGGRIVDDDEIKDEPGRRAPLRRLARAGQIRPRRPARPRTHAHAAARLGRRSPAASSGTPTRSCA